MILFSFLMLFILNTPHFYVVNAYTKKVLPKCCPESQVVLDNYDFNIDCIDKTADMGDITYSDAYVYDKNIHDKRIDKSFNDIFLMAADRRPDIDDFRANYVCTENLISTYLGEDGILYASVPNAYPRFTPLNTSNCCVDYQISNGTLKENLKFWCKNDDMSSERKTSILHTPALLMSAAFLFLLLVVYASLPELRNLGGLIVMAYVSSLMTAFLFLAIIKTYSLDTDTCIILTTFTYFFFLATFCWMNVMSFDIWWTFRGYAKGRTIHRRGEGVKFLTYCVYGCGVPLAMAIAFVVINNTDLSHMPWIVKPLIPEGGCFITGGQKLLYLYVPMLMLIICNWMFFLMTAFNIWRINHASAILDSLASCNRPSHRSQKNRLLVYLKLSIVMGISWVLEVASWFAPDLGIWQIIDLYNVLMGFYIFLIFVCKRRIFIQLRNRYFHGPKGFLARSQN